jgi:hypothetical protein
VASTLEDVILRYLAAFGPATVRDIQTWSGLTRLREVVERLRPSLRVFRNERGGELFDLPEAPRPDSDTPAPPRFLPEYDNVLLSHTDRTRIIPDDRQIPLLPGNGGTAGTLLVDGFFRGIWNITKRDGTATLVIKPFTILPEQERTALTEEGERLLMFAAGDGLAHDIRFASPE